MSAARSRIARTLIGAACIAAATCALVWFAFQFAPGEPRERTTDREPLPSTISTAGNRNYEAERIVDVPFGQTYRTVIIAGRLPRRSTLSCHTVPRRAASC